MFRSRKKHDQELLRNYKKLKGSTFDFERIALFFINTDKPDAHQIIPYRTLLDLDFEELFMFMDRTCSKPGQQYLYTTLRTIPKNKNRSTYFEKIIHYLNENPEIKESIIPEISRLNENRAYYLQSLIHKKNIVKPKWFWVVYLFSGLSVTALILSFIFPVFVLLLILILTINSIFHYWNKRNILIYSNAIPQLLILNKVTDKMIHLGAFLNNIDQIRKSNYAISKISRLAVFFKLEPILKSELGLLADYLQDIIKASFLLEPILLFKIIRQLELKKPEISNVFEAVAQVDVAISIASFRDALPYYSMPDITEKKRSFCAEEMYHPLLTDPVANTLDLSDGKSVLISGSNMSGKTTFIRTIGVNAILSQTINTACARQFKIPKLKVHSAIKISDSLLDDTSYYYEEVKTIKKMISEVGSGYQNLFLLDEIFKGTNTVERISSGKAVLSYINRHDNLVIVSTHDLELIELLRKDYNYFHFEETIENNALIFDYKLKNGKLTNTNAIRILEINEFPEEITMEAKKLATQIREIDRIRNDKQ